MAATVPGDTSAEFTGPNTAPVVVLVHGLGLNSACWQWMVPQLSETFQVITYDLYGHGKSGRPPETPSLAMFSRQLAELLDDRGIARAAMVGFSLGGMIARRFAQDHPDRVTALGILHSPHRRTADAQTAILKRVEQARSDGPASTVEAALERWFTDGYRYANPETMDRVRGWVMANDIEIYHTIYRVLAEGVAEIVHPDPPITAPTLAITGDEDYGNGPEMTRAIAAEIAGAEVLILPGLRHMALAEDPSAVNDPLIRFLKRVLLDT